MVIDWNQGRRVVTFFVLCSTALATYADDCPPYPEGITRTKLNGKAVVISVSSIEPISSATDSMELASAEAKLEAKHSLAKSVFDGQTLFGVSELFSCSRRGYVFAGVMVAESMVSVPAQESAKAIYSGPRFSDSELRW